MNAWIDPVFGYSIDGIVWLFAIWSLVWFWFTLVYLPMKAARR